eukprot:tig00001472_g8888.t1
MDAGLLKLLVRDAANAEAAAAVNDDLLRRHFLELTSAFLAPFEAYFAPRLPAAPYSELPPLEPFRQDDFLRAIQSGALGGELTGGKSKERAEWASLYRRFIQSPNFGVWFEGRRRKARAEQAARQRAALEALDVAAVTRGMQEVQLIDMALKLGDHLEREGSTETAFYVSLNAALGAVLDRLPPRTRAALAPRVPPPPTPSSAPPPPSVQRPVSHRPATPSGAPVAL